MIKKKAIAIIVIILFATGCGQNEDEWNYSVDAGQVDIDATQLDFNAEQLDINDMPIVKPDDSAETLTSISDMFGDSDFRIKYKMVLKYKGETSETDFEYYYKNGVLVEMHDSGRAIFSDDKIYFVNDVNKTSEVDQYQLEEGSFATLNKLLFMLFVVEGGYYTIGGTVVRDDGRTLTYAGFVDELENGSKEIIRIFFDGDDVFSVQFVGDEGTLVLENLSFDQNILDSVFEIPNDYIRKG